MSDRVDRANLVDVVVLFLFHPVYMLAIIASYWTFGSRGRFSDVVFSVAIYMSFWPIVVVGFALSLALAIRASHRCEKSIFVPLSAIWWLVWGMELMSLYSLLFVRFMTG